MRENGVNIQRNELYKQVWKTPITKLAKKYGISDVGLKKICKKLNVPTPPRGYWARIYSGQKPKRVDLPRLKHGQVDAYYLDERTEVRHQPEIGVGDDTRQLIVKITKNSVIHVPKRLVKPHPLVSNTLSKMQKGYSDHYNIIRASGNSCLDIRVSKDSVMRACRITNVLIKSFEKNGFEISIKDRATRILVPGIDDKVRIYIREKVRQVDHEMTAEEAADEKRRGWSYAPKCDYEPTGSLGLFIDEYTSNGLKKRWVDTPKRQIEDVLPDFVVGIVKMADCLRRRRLEREEEKRRWEEERCRRQKLEELRQIEMEKRANLEKQARRWEQSRCIREFIVAVREEAMKSDQTATDQDSLKDWVNWASEHADRLDPLSAGLPFNSSPE